MKSKSNKKPYSKGPVKLRSKYSDQSQKFKDWVDQLGFEQTLLGKIVQSLDERFHIRRVSMLFFYCLVLSFLLFFDFDFQQDVEVGTIAKSDFKASLSFVMVDEVATEKKRNEAEGSVPPVFDYDPISYKGITEPVYLAFREFRALVRKTRWSKNETKKEEQVKDFLINKPKFEEIYGRKISNRLFEWLVQGQFSVRTENIIKNALTEWTSEKIVDIPHHIVNFENKTVILKIVDGRKYSAKEVPADLSKITNINDESVFTLKNIKKVKSYSRVGRKNLKALSKILIFPNVTFNKVETSDRNHRARDAILPVQISIKKNQTIVSQGSIIQPVHVTIFHEIKKRKSDRRTDFIALMSALMFATFILVFFSYTKRFTLNRVRIEQRDLAVMGVIALVAVLVIKIFLFMTEAAFVTKYGLPPSMFLYAAPVSAAAMIVGMLVTSGEVVWLFTVFISIVLTVMTEMNFSFFLVSLVGGVTAVRGVHSCEKRNDIYRAGLRVGLVNGLTVFFITMLTNIGSQDLLRELAWDVPASFFGGLFSAMVTMMLIPVVESIFNYTTDIKLLELSNLSHPLMKEMVLKAPGTYHHSLVVGSMVDAAAKEIGANALLGKVMAYYHDIGKMDHAQYFIENQRKGFNPHDHISPYMSKTILIAHVKDGAELGLKHKLGRPIIDGILQHHGTTLISYFYNRALEGHDDDHGYVEESDFRYPGPKPQFKEAALVMLADSIEAAARSLDDPTPARLQNIVQSIIQNKFMDAQLSDCDLTLQDLSIIEESFEHVILAIYHQRVEYPGQAKSEPKESGKKNVTRLSPKLGS